MLLTAARDFKYFLSQFPEVLRCEFTMPGGYADGSKRTFQTNYIANLCIAPYRNKAMYSTTTRFTHRSILSYKKSNQSNPNLPNIETFQEITLNSQKNAYIQKGGFIQQQIRSR